MVPCVRERERGREFLVDGLFGGLYVRLAPLYPENFDLGIVLIIGYV